jgi:hypothetical protein
MAARRWKWGSSLPPPSFVVFAAGLAAPKLAHRWGLARVAQIADGQCISIVTADGTCDTRACHAAIAARGAAAVIPPRKNGRLWKAMEGYGRLWKELTAGAAVRNDALRRCRRFGRAIWKRWTGYHRRRLVEAKMRCFKRLGERVMSRDFARQLAELQVRAAIPNRFTALGTPLTQRAG